MAKFSLRRYDTQARVSVLLALASIGTLLIQTFFVLQNMDFNELVIYYGQNRRMGVLGATAVTMLLAVASFGFGLNSVGQRRNDKQSWSWAGFFIGAGVFCLTVAVFFLFFSRGESSEALR